MSRILKRLVLGSHWLPRGIRKRSTLQSTVLMNDPKLENDFFGKYISPSERVLIKDLEPWLEEAAENVQLNLAPGPDSGRSVTLCDYGTADSTTSSRAVSKMLGILRQRYGSNQQLMVVYEDQPRNNYMPVFLRAHGLLPGSDSHFLKADPNVFVTACGTGFYSQCLPDNTVTIGFSNGGFHILSKVPCTLKNAVMPHFGASSEELAVWKDAARTDWEDLLLLRAKEMTKGGYFAVSMFAGLPEGRFLSAKALSEPGCVSVPQKVHEHLLGMLNDKLITQKEVENVNMPCYSRTEEEVRAPFANPDSLVRKAGLELIKTKFKDFDCIFRTAHQEVLQDNPEAFVPMLSHIQQGTVKRTILASFSQGRSMEEAEDLANEYMRRERESMAANPDDYHHGATVLYALMRKI